MAVARLPLVLGDLASRADGGVRVPRVPCAPARCTDLAAGCLPAVGRVSPGGDVSRVFTEVRSCFESAARTTRRVWQ